MAAATGGCIEIAGHDYRVRALVENPPFSGISTSERKFPLHPVAHSFLTFLYKKFGIAHPMHICGSAVLAWLDGGFGARDIDVWFTSPSRVLFLSMKRAINLWLAEQSQVSHVKTTAVRTTHIEVEIILLDGTSPQRFSLVFAGALDRFDRFDISGCSVAISVSNVLYPEKSGDVVTILAPYFSVFTDIRDKELCAWAPAVDGEYPADLEKNPDWVAAFGEMVARVKKYESRGFKVHGESEITSSSQRHWSIFGYVCGVELGQCHGEEPVSMDANDNDVDAIQQALDIALDAFAAYRAQLLRRMEIDMGETEKIDWTMDKKRSRGACIVSPIYDGGCELPCERSAETSGPALTEVD